MGLGNIGLLSAAQQEMLPAFVMVARTRIVFTGGDRLISNPPRTIQPGWIHPIGLGLNFRPVDQIGAD